MLSLSSASDDTEDPNRIRSLVLDIEDNRHAKVQRGLEQLDENTTKVNITNVCAMELNRIRQITAGALDQMRTLDHRTRGAEDGSFSASQSQPAAAGDDVRSERLDRALQQRGRVT